jgi:hypothetical protein
VVLLGAVAELLDLLFTLLEEFLCLFVDLLTSLLQDLFARLTRLLLCLGDYLVGLLAGLCAYLFGLFSGFRDYLFGLFLGVFDVPQHSVSLSRHGYCPELGERGIWKFPFEPQATNPSATNSVLMSEKNRGDERLPEGFGRRFWKLVFLLNVGPVAVAVAFYLVVFRGTSDLFWASLSVGVASLTFAAREYFVARSVLVEANEG